MIIIDGVVGVGKSTLMNILSQKYDLQPFREPVVNNPILHKFYYDRSRYSFPLQLFFFNKRLEQLKQASETGQAVLDRSIYGDLIFSKLLHENKEMSDEEYDIYIDLFNNMAEHIPTPELLIYLDISPDNAIKRITKRGRDFEMHTERTYWERLNKNYNEFFNKYAYSPILKINVNDVDFENNLSDKEYVLSLIDDKLKK